MEKVAYERITICVGTGDSVEPLTNPLMEGKEHCRWLRKCVSPTTGGNDGKGLPPEEHTPGVCEEEMVGEGRREIKTSLENALSMYILRLKLRQVNVVIAPVFYYCRTHARFSLSPC